ncbi:MAG: response regulator transcription factor [Gammaproteobacteria bacterium]|nr:response regulator transcription factor [Gammaproteobacteria bacterium]
MANILLIDDDVRLADLLNEYFQRFGFSMSHAAHPKEGLAMQAEGGYDLIILDIMLPDMDGFEVLRELRKYSEIPVIMLTARGDVMDRVVGLELGADDYLPKPFEPRELVARMQNILKRSHMAKDKTLLSWPALQIDAERLEVKCNGDLVELTSKEFQLLSLLAGEPGKNFSRDDILNHLRGIDADIFSRAVDILISRLRSKLQPLDCIKTNWGSGYSFIAPVE